MAEIIQIFTCSQTGGKTVEAAEVTAKAGCGLAGDRYFIDNSAAANKNAITLQSIEAIQACNRQLNTDFTPSAFRRNLITQGIELNELLGKKFRVGDVLLYAWELCQPCRYLQDMLGADLLTGLLDRGGLRAEILVGGKIRPGQKIVILDQENP